MPLRRETDTLTVPYLIDVYQHHGWDALLSHLSSQMTSKRMSVLCTALGIAPAQCTARAIARRIADMVDKPGGGVR